MWDYYTDTRINWEIFFDVVASAKKVLIKFSIILRKFQCAFCIVYEKGIGSSLYTPVRARLLDLMYINNSKKNNERHSTLFWICFIFFWLYRDIPRYILIYMQYKILCNEFYDENAYPFFDSFEHVNNLMSNYMLYNETFYFYTLDNTKSFILWIL